MVETARVQYVFFDVVGFTRDRSVEAQSGIVACLNDVVTRAVQAMDLPMDHIVFLPTGDGMAIALIDVSGVDIHLRLAIGILQQISEHNSRAADEMRRFEVRIGINENVDNIVLDINGRRNVAGAGISMAQRIMDKADAGQILVGRTVYEILRQREKYMSSFREFAATGKHGVTLPVYQFLSKDFPGLSVNPPSAFLRRKIEPAKLTKFVAYYMAHAVKNRAFFLSRKRDSLRDQTAIVLLTFLAEDSVRISETPSHDKPTIKTWQADTASFQQQYEHYREVDFWPQMKLADLLVEKHLTQYAEYFEGGTYTQKYTFVKQAGIQKLKAEWAQIANELALT
jgi:class 3 adenylate cyclase